MFVNLKNTGIISVVVLMALVGLIVIQFSWLQGVLTLREEKLKKELADVIDRVDVLFTEFWDDQFPLTEVTANGGGPREEEFLAIIEALIRKAMSTHNLGLEFEYALSTCRSDHYRYFSDLSRREEILKGESIRLGSCTFRENDHDDEHFHLYTIFPRKDLFVFRQVALAAASSILFLLLILGAFGYTIAIILKQKKLSEMKNDFINNLTHEFKTPIASISLAAKTLMKLPEVSDSLKARNYVDLIDQEGRRLDNHVDKVLQMALLDSGNFVLDKKELGLEELIQRVTSSFELLLEKKKGRFCFNFLAPSATLKADPMHLFNILFNLIDNAIKYNNRPPEIHITTVANPGYLEIAVKDNGIGMSPEVQKRIFDKFYRQKTGNVHDVKGFGLGLSYVRRMVEAHSGTIRIHSIPEFGTTFFLTFPNQ